MSGGRMNYVYSKVETAASDIRCNDYTRILFYRKDLFTVACIGFMSSNVGDLWCAGSILKDRLPKLTAMGIWFEVNRC